MKYIKELDSLRAIAVVLVIISHWVPHHYLINKFPNDVIGVEIFFVLSGFLISKILFDNKIKVEQCITSNTRVLKNFYVRRSLRIFPIYYLTIVLLFIFSNYIDINIKSEFVYYATYTTNFYLFSIQSWYGILTHLWSLAVEEQFYLVWPLVILFTDKKYLLGVLVIFVLTGISGQYFMMHINMSNILTFNCFDAFGLGALLAWQITYAPRKLKKFYSVMSWLAILSFFIFLFEIFNREWQFVPLNTLICIMALWLITYINLNHDSGTAVFRLIFQNRILIFLGKISYGMYLYHNIIPHALNTKLVNKYVNPLLPDLLFKKYWGQLYFLENAFLLILISWFSYRIIEQRFLQLKTKFAY